MKQLLLIFFFLFSFFFSSFSQTPCTSTHTTCDSAYTWPFNGQTYTTSGFYTTVPQFSPTLAGTDNTPTSASGVAVNGNYAYVAADWSGLDIIDISNPSAPTLNAN